MSILLHVDSSPMGDLSISRELTREFVEGWRKAHPKGSVLSRDLAALNISPIDAENIKANYAQDSRTKHQNEILARPLEFARDLLDAEEYVIGVPMHNWGPSSSFKLWTDQIVLIGETVRMTPKGAIGTLKDKKATFIISAGRNFGSGSGNESRNYLIPWIKTFFGNLGVEKMTFIFADGSEGVLSGRLDRNKFLAPHIEAVRALFAEPLCPSLSTKFNPERKP